MNAIERVAHFMRNYRQEFVARARGGLRLDSCRALAGKQKLMLAFHFFAGSDVVDDRQRRSCAAIRRCFGQHARAVKALFLLVSEFEIKALLCAAVESSAYRAIARDDKILRQPEFSIGLAGIVF